MVRIEVGEVGWIVGRVGFNLREKKNVVFVTKGFVDLLVGINYFGEVF